LETAYFFNEWCLSGNRLELKTNDTVQVKGRYKDTHVRKAIHLIRDPFNNYSWKASPRIPLSKENAQLADKSPLNNLRECVENKTTKCSSLWQKRARLVTNLDLLSWAYFCGVFCAGAYKAPQ